MEQGAPPLGGQPERPATLQASVGGAARLHHAAPEPRRCAFHPRREGMELEWTRARLSSSRQGSGHRDSLGRSRSSATRGSRPRRPRTARPWSRARAHEVPRPGEPPRPLARGDRGPGCGVDPRPLPSSRPRRAPLRSAGSSSRTAPVAAARGPERVHCRARGRCLGIDPGPGGPAPLPRAWGSSRSGAGCRRRGLRWRPPGRPRAGPVARERPPRSSGLS